MRPASTRLLASVALLAVVAGCGGPGQQSSAPSSSAAPSTSAAAPSGPGCVDPGDLAKLTDKGLVDAMSAMPQTTQFAAYAALDKARTKKLNSLSGVTAFVPVDAAWAKLDEATVAKLADPTWQAAAVEYALVAATYAPDDFDSGKTQSMATFRAAGSTLSGAQTPDGIVLNGAARVSCSAIPFEGGLIYLTDTVLLPPA